MNAASFRRIALSLEGAKEGSHLGASDFRVRGRIFATLASQRQGYGNLMLTPELQAEFIQELPEVFLPVPGGWGRMGNAPRPSSASERGCSDGCSAHSMEAQDRQEQEECRDRTRAA